MKKVILSVISVLLVFSVQVSFGIPPHAGEQIEKDTRCPVCGMFVAKYKQWLTQLHMSDGTILTFDGVKDMMAYYFSPKQFGAADSATVSEVVVKDYYNQQWRDGKQAMYVLGSDVYGPMGHELIPFVDKAEAESFQKDHHGKQIVEFSEITLEMVEKLRKGHKMKGHGTKHMKEKK